MVSKNLRLLKIHDHGVQGVLDLAAPLDAAPLAAEVVPAPVCLRNAVKVVYAVLQRLDDDLDVRLCQSVFHGLKIHIVVLGGRIRGQATPAENSWIRGSA